MLHVSLRSPPLCILKGVLHLATIHHPFHLLAFNVEAGTFEEYFRSAHDWDYSGILDEWRDFTMQFLSRTDQICYCDYHLGGYLVVCNDRLLMFTAEPDNWAEVLGFDVESLELVVLSTVPSRVGASLRSNSISETKLTAFTAPVNDDFNVFFGCMDVRGHQVVRAYNVRDDHWGCPAAPPNLGVSCTYESMVSFQPGLSPFLSP